MKKTKQLVLKVNSSYFRTKRNKKLTMAAKTVVKEIESHFRKDKWPLDYSFYKDEVFSIAFNENLENYLLSELFKKSRKYHLVSKDGRMLIGKSK